MRDEDTRAVGREDQRTIDPCPMGEDQVTEFAERKTAAIEAERARLKSIVEAAPLPLFLFDADLQVTLHNSAGLRLLESVGLKDHFAAHGNVNKIEGLQTLDDEGKLLGLEDCPLQRSLRGETVRDELFRWRIGADPVRVFRVNTAPVKDARSRVTGVLGAFSDVTEHVRLQDRERAIALKLQRSFLPQELPEMPGFELTTRYHPARHEDFVGGDFFDVFQVGEGKFGVVIADVAGKGVESAVYTAMTKYMLRAYALEEYPPELVLPRLNKALTAYTPTEVFITLIYGILDVETPSFTYANAGHEQPMFFSSDQGAATLLDVTGRALALMDGSSYATQTVPMREGDALLLYTDGITDAGSGANRLGHDSVLRILESHSLSPIRELADSIRGAALEFAGGKLSDDAALLVVRALGIGPEHSRSLLSEDC